MTKNAPYSVHHVADGLADAYANAAAEMMEAHVEATVLGSVSCEPAQHAKAALEAALRLRGVLPPSETR